MRENAIRIGHKCIFGIGFFIIVLLLVSLRASINVGAFLCVYLLYICGKTTTMKSLIPLLLLSISLHAQDEIIIDFREDVIVWQERETKRGKKKMVELYSGFVGDIGPFIAQVNEPSTLVVSCIAQDSEYYIHLPDGLNRGIPLYLKWERKDITIRDTETGAVVTMAENTSVFK